MKKEKRLLDILGQVDGKYIAEAAPGKKEKSGKVKSIKANKKPGWIKWASAAACCFIILAAASLPFLQYHSEEPLPSEDNAPHSETQIPPEPVQSEPVSPEPAPSEPAPPPTVISVNGLHLVQLAAVQTAPEISTDFIIHINPNLYIGREENGTYVIRPTTPLSDEFPECSLQIHRIAGTPPAAAAESIRKNLTESWQNISNIEDSSVIDGLFLHADNGSAWNAEQTDVTITDDGLGGSYILTARYFTEAAEGHGVRFADMAGTFKAVTSADTAAMPAYLVDLHNTVSEFTSAFFSDQTVNINGLLAPDTKIYTYDADVSEDVTIASIDYSISGEENPTAAVVSVKHRINTEDSYNYLTIELTYTADGRWIIHFAGIEK